MEYKTKEWYEYMLRVVEDDIGNMPISALKAYQIERIYADMREPDAKRTYCVTATELDKIRKEKGILGESTLSVGPPFFSFSISGLRMCLQNGGSAVS